MKSDEAMGRLKSIKFKNENDVAYNNPFSVVWGGGGGAKCEMNASEQHVCESVCVCVCS